MPLAADSEWALTVNVGNSVTEPLTGTHAADAGPGVHG